MTYLLQIDSYFAGFITYGARGVSFYISKEIVLIAKTDKIIVFIQHRFANIDINWLNGNCYWLAHRLCARFPYLKIYYMPINRREYLVIL